MKLHTVVIGVAIALQVLNAEEASPRIVNLSKHDNINRNKNLDFKLLKQKGIRGVIIRASMGDGKNAYAPEYPDSDPLFEQYFSKTHSAGLLLGAYHLVRAGQDGRQQADHFLATIAHALPKNASPVSVLLVADGGWSDIVKKATSSEELSNFAQRVKDKTGVYPGIYPEKNEEFRKNLASANDVQRAVFKNCWLWFPDYSKIPPRLDGWTHLLPGPLMLHQYGGVQGGRALVPHGFDDQLATLPYLLEKSIFLGDSLEVFWTANSAKFGGN